MLGMSRFGLEQATHRGKLLLKPGKDTGAQSLAVLTRKGGGGAEGFSKYLKRGQQRVPVTLH